MPSKSQSGPPPPRRHAAFEGLIGAAEADITPPIGIYARSWGAALHDAADSIHRPLVLTALAIQAGHDKPPLIMITADLGWWQWPDLETRFRNRLLEALDLAPERLIFAVSHTHAAPPLNDQPKPEWQGGELLKPYIEQVYAAAIDTATGALANMQTGILDWHTGRCNLAATRDMIDPDDPSRYICGYDPAVSADDTLVVGRATDADGKTMATICNYACHPTTLAWENTAISPDYIGAMRETVQDHTGGAPVLFLQGASGELAPRCQYVGDTAVPDRHGRQLGHAVIATLEDMEPAGQELAYMGVEESGAPLAVWRHKKQDISGRLTAKCITIELKLREVPVKETSNSESDDRVMNERRRRRAAIRESIGDGDTFPLSAWVWRIGDGCLTGSKCEAYSCIQTRLREAFPERTIAFANLINGCVGYLPPKSLYSEDVYQVWQTPFAPGSLEQLEDAITAELREG